MVNIRDLTDSESETSDEEANVVEQLGEKPPDPPDCPESSRPSNVLLPIVSFGGSQGCMWHLLCRYGNCSGPYLTEGHRCQIAEEFGKWTPLQWTELHRLQGGPNGHEEHFCDPNFQFTCPLIPATGNYIMQDNRYADRATTITAVTESSVGQSTDETVDKEDGSKTESEDSTKEKSNGIGEKQQLAAAAVTAAKAAMNSSSEMSDNELSDVSDSLAPLDYDSIQKEQNNETYATTTLTDSECTKDFDRNLVKDVHPELAESSGKEPSYASDEGEAAALPTTSQVKDCWEQWVDDDQLFTLNTNAPVPSTSSAPEEIPSPCTERRRTQKENRKSACKRQASRTVKRYIFVATDKIGRIVGKGGRRIREIERKSGAIIKIEKRKSSEPMTQIKLTGTEDQIALADEEIGIVIRNFKPPRSGELTTVSVSNVDEEELRRLLLTIKNQVLDVEKEGKQ